jgi:TonB family protein
MSALIHAGAIAVVLFLTTSKHSPLTIIIPISDTRITQPRLPRMGKTGGGGDRSPAPAQKGIPPRAAPRVFATPVMLIKNSPPILPVPPEVLGVETNQPAVDLAHLGIVNGVPNTGSAGMDRGPGIGDKKGSGIGKDGGDSADGGDGIPSANSLPRKNSTRPQLLSKIEPEYSDEARKVKLQGKVLLNIVVNANGSVGDISVVQSLGLGLDERAMSAVHQWKFRAATVDGKPIAVRAFVEVDFHLL